MATLLIVEDDRKTNDAICEYLKPAGHKVIPAYDGVEALQLFRENNIDLVVLDIMLPHVSGLSILHEIRRSSTTPILMLTALEDEYTQVRSFDEQADDYMTKPFSIAVLKVRLQNILQRKRTDADAGRTVVSGDIVLDLKSFRASCGGEDMDLSMTEFRLLQYFMEHKNQALLKEQILQHIWDEGGNYVEENTLSVNVSRLRKKLGRDHIRTIQGIGYLWEEG